MKATVRAAGLMRDRLDAGEWLDGDRLPTLDELSSSCSVSRSTMWRAVSLLQKENLIHTRRGGAMYAGAAGSVTVKPAKQTAIWLRLKETIGQTILWNNDWRPQLPPINKLARQYNTSLDTCRKVLNALVTEGLLIRDGRSFRKARDRPPLRKRAVLLVSEGDSERGIIISDPRTERLVDSFEGECARLGYGVQCEGFALDDPAGLMRMLARIKDLGAFAGCIVNMWKPWNKPRMQAWVDFYKVLVDHGVTIVAVDQSGSVEFPSSLLQNQRFRALRIAGVRAGEMVGQMLAHAKHRRIAYLMSESDVDWARNRYDGLRRSFQLYGPPGATIELHPLSPVGDATDLTLSIADLDEKETRDVYREQVGRDDVQNVSDRLRSPAIKSLAAVIIDNRAARSVRQVARYTLDMARKKHDPWVYSTLHAMMVHVASNIAANEQNQSRFATALKKTKATVWVCPEDKTALGALSFLRDKGVRVPDDIAVIGFENWREAHEQQLTTYDFNMAGMVQQALLMIMDEKIFKSKAAISEVDGYVVERRTTKR